MGKVVMPKCEFHQDCFANKKGRCICLSENDFGERDCPFYKVNASKKGLPTGRHNSEGYCDPVVYAVLRKLGKKKGENSL